MVVLNQHGSDDPSNYDLSFIYSKQCNLSCSFCMYEGGPSKTEVLDIERLACWLGTVDMNRIASFGVYGGEPSINLAGFGACLDLVAHLGKPHFVITNGSWSLTKSGTAEFLSWCSKYRMHVVVSGTPEHREYQDRQVLEAWAEQYPNAFRLKPTEENFHAMGRLADKMPFSCSRKCMAWKRALRIGVQPDGTIIYQNCDGAYPVVGTIQEDFAEMDERVQRCRREGFHCVCPHYIVIERELRVCP